jgi:hypothetical protein
VRNLLRDVNEVAKALSAQALTGFIKFLFVTETLHLKGHSSISKIFELVYNYCLNRRLTIPSLGNRMLGCQVKLCNFYGINAA